jgi:hypothetical protein
MAVCSIKQDKQIENFVQKGFKKKFCVQPIGCDRITWDDDRVIQ